MPRDITPESALADIQGLLDSAPAAPASDEKKKDDDLAKPYPGLGKLTYGLVKALDLKDTEIEALKRLYIKHDSAIHIFRTDRNLFCIRECSRLEWKTLQVKLQNAIASVVQKMKEQNYSDAAIQTAVLMYIEEQTALHMMVYPEYEGEDERMDFLRRQVPGETKTVAEAVSVALGFGEQMPPLRL